MNVVDFLGHLLGGFTFTRPQHEDEPGERQVGRALVKLFLAFLAYKWSPTAFGWLDRRITGIKQLWMIAATISMSVLVAGVILWTLEPTRGLVLFLAGLVLTFTAGLGAKAFQNRGHGKLAGFCWAFALCSFLLGTTFVLVSSNVLELPERFQAFTAWLQDGRVAAAKAEAEEAHADAAEIRRKLIKARRELREVKETGVQLVSHEIGGQTEVQADVCAVIPLSTKQFHVLGDEGDSKLVYYQLIGAERGPKIEGNLGAWLKRERPDHFVACAEEGADTVTLSSGWGRAPGT